LLLSWRFLWFFSGYGLITVYQYVTGTDTMCLSDWSCHMLVARPSFWGLRKSCSCSSMVSIEQCWIIGSIGADRVTLKHF
jgi:hypothetical protein